MSKDKILVEMEKAGFPLARCLGSKSGYRNMYPKNEVIFNAKVYSKKAYQKYRDNIIRDWFEGQETESWYGDLDLTLDKNRLIEVAKKAGTLYITSKGGSQIEEIHGN